MRGVLRKLQFEQRREDRGGVLFAPFFYPGLFVCLFVCLFGGMLTYGGVAFAALFCRRSQRTERESVSLEEEKKKY